MYSWRRTHDKLENNQVKEVRKAKAPQPTAMIFFRGMIIFFEFFDTPLWILRICVFFV
jgi:hypothetical protein